MLRVALVIALAWFVASVTATRLRAVATTETATFDPAATQSPYYTYTYTYVTTEPTVDHWTTATAWGSPGVTGWNYVGSDNGASAVFLGDGTSGNGYVLTAAHVGAGNFILDGQTYNEISNSAMQIGTADLTLYQIDTTSTTGNYLNLPSLTLPAQGSIPTVGSSVVMIGYGNSAGEAWATNTVYENNQTTTLGTTLSSLDFYTVDSFSQVGSNPNVTMTKNGQLVPGDSGGADFIYNSVSGKWELVGINEVLLEDQTNSDKIVGSGMVQTGSYATLISAAMVPTPEPPSWLLALAGLATLGGMGAAKRRAV